jgi:hypothetical protein
MSAVIERALIIKGLRSRQRGYVRMRLGKRRGSRDPGGGGGGPGGGGPDEGGEAGLRVGLNLAGITTFNGSNYFIDKMRQVSELWNGSVARTDPSLDANHFPANLANGANYAIPVWNNLQNLRQTQKMKAGLWKVTFDTVGGGGCTVDLVLTDGITGAGSSSSTAATGSFNFTVSAGGTTASCWLRVRNLTGAGGRGVTNLKIFHTDHETALLAGEVFDPDFLAYLLQFPDMRFVRFLDWQAGDFVSLTYQSWARSDLGVPPELIGMLAKKLREGLGRDVTMWTVMPRLANDAYMAAFFTKVFAGDPAGTWPLRCEGVNEPWNSGFPAYNYFGLTYYSANSLTVYTLAGAPGGTAFNERLTASYVHHAMRTWTAADAVFGSSRVIPVICPQTGFYAFIGPWIHQRDTTNTLYGGVPALSIINARGKLGFTMYWNLYSMGTSIKQNLINDVGAQSEASILASWQSHMDDIENDELLYSINLYRAAGVTCPVTMYEGNNHDFYDKASNISGQAADFYGTADTGNNTFIMADGTGWIDDGDLMINPNQNAILGTSFPYFYYVRKFSTNRIRCYLTQAAYLADSGNTGAGSATVVAGTWYFANQSRFARWSDKLSAIMKGSTGLSAFQYAVGIMQNPTINCDSFALFAAGTGGDQFGNTRFSYCFDAQNNGVYGSLSPAVSYLAGLTG